MNKIKSLYLTTAALAALAGLGACTQEAEPQISKDAIELCSTIRTRALDQSLQNTQLAEGQEAGVFITNDSQTALYSNNKMIAGANGSFSYDTTMVWGATDKINIRAYHPYNSNYTADADNDFSVQLDQSTDAGYKASDLLYADADNQDKTFSPIPLTFSHKLAKVCITLTAAADVDLKGAIVSVAGTRIAATFTPADGTLGTASGDAKTIKVAAFAADATTFDCAALIIPQTVAKDTKFIEVSLPGGLIKSCYKITDDNGKTFESGGVYNYTINVTQ